MLALRNLVEHVQRFSYQIQVTAHLLFSKQIAVTGDNDHVINWRYWTNTSVYDIRVDFRFPIISFPWFSGDVPRLQSYGIYISQLVSFAWCCTSILDIHSKNLKNNSNIFTQSIKYHKLRKTLERFQFIPRAFVQIGQDITSRIWFWMNLSPSLLPWYKCMMYTIRKCGK